MSVYVDKLNHWGHTDQVYDLWQKDMEWLRRHQKNLSKSSIFPRQALDMWTDFKWGQLEKEASKFKREVQDEEDFRTKQERFRRKVDRGIKGALAGATVGAVGGGVLGGRAGLNRANTKINTYNNAVSKIPFIGKKMKQSPSSVGGDASIAGAGGGAALGGLGGAAVGGALGYFTG